MVRRVAWTAERIRPLVHGWVDALTGAGTPRSASAPREPVPCPPATEREITESRCRLGVSLPPSYRSFLLFSTGAQASSLGLGGHHGLLPVRELVRITDHDEDFVRRWTLPDMVE